MLEDAWLVVSGKSEDRNGKFADGSAACVEVDCSSAAAVEVDSHRFDGAPEQVHAGRALVLAAVAAERATLAEERAAMGRRKGCARLAIVRRGLW